MIKILLNCKGYKGKYTNSLNNISSPPIWGNKIIIWERYSKYSEILFPHLKKIFPHTWFSLKSMAWFTSTDNESNKKQKDFNLFLESSSASFEMKLMHTQPQNSDR